MKHRRKRPRGAISCGLCQSNKRHGVRGLSGGNKVDGLAKGSLLRLRERAREAA